MKITNLLLFFMKIFTWRMKIVKCECILAYNSGHFNHFIGKSCSTYTHKSSFWWALIWYKILCDTNYTLSCRWERNGFVTLCIWTVRIIMVVSKSIRQAFERMIFRYLFKNIIRSSSGEKPVMGCFQIMEMEMKHLPKPYVHMTYENYSGSIEIH